MGATTQTETVPTIQNKLRLNYLRSPHSHTSLERKNSHNEAAARKKLNLIVEDVHEREFHS